MTKIILDHGRLARLVARHQRQGRSVALTNGVFDLFHVGHLRSLQGAKRRAGILVVAVNDDRSTRRYKGPGRPLVPAAERMEILAGLSCVDYVTLFSEPTVARLILCLAPDFHAKGTDYTPETDPEREAVAAVGGKTLIVGDAKRHSVTDLIGKVIRSCQFPVAGRQSAGKRKKRRKSTGDRGPGTGD